MSDLFLNSIKKTASRTTTLNGAIAYNTTHSSLLDFFAECGASRNLPEKNIINKFEKSFAENPLLTLKCLFYFRDIREGQGERRLFRIILKHLGNERPTIIMKNIDVISEYGRYDDLLCLLDTNSKKYIIKYIGNKLREDEKSEYPSLLAKWIPSENTSSYKTRLLAKEIRTNLKMGSKRYRKLLSSIREKINITERLISANRWEELDLSKLTANNYLKYKQAFNKHIPEQWDNYILSLSQGKTKIKSSTLYPYDIVSKVRDLRDENERKLLDEMWKALPDYSNGSNENALCMVDVSGSMYETISSKSDVTALDVSISLGLYLSERIDGCFNNHFLTFSEKPEMVEVIGKDLKSKVTNIIDSNWGYNTNFKKAFKLILDTALENNLTQEDMPNKLIVVSDMQFDSACDTDDTKSLFENIKIDFNNHGYEMPTVVFWNVLGTKTTFQVDKNCQNVLLCSGCSPTILNGVLKYNNPMDLVLGILNSNRYNKIVL